MLVVETVAYAVRVVQAPALVVGTAAACAHAMTLAGTHAPQGQVATVRITSTPLALARLTHALSILA